MTLSATAGLSLLSGCNQNMNSENGEGRFESMVSKFEGIEKKPGLYELVQFTPQSGAV